MGWPLTRGLFHMYMQASNFTSKSTTSLNMVCCCHMIKIVVKGLFILSGARDVKYTEWNLQISCRVVAIRYTIHGYCFIIWFINSNLLTLSQHILCSVWKLHYIYLKKLFYRGVAILIKNLFRGPAVPVNTSI